MNATDSMTASDWINLAHVGALAAVVIWQQLREIR